MFSNRLPQSSVSEERPRQDEQMRAITENAASATGRRQKGAAPQQAWL